MTARQFKKIMRYRMADTDDRCCARCKYWEMLRKTSETSSDLHLMYTTDKCMANQGRLFSISVFHVCDRFNNNRIQKE